MEFTCAATTWPTPELWAPSARSCKNWDSGPSNKCRSTPPNNPQSRTTTNWFCHWRLP